MIRVLYNILFEVTNMDAFFSFKRSDRTRVSLWYLDSLKESSIHCGL